MMFEPDDNLIEKATEAAISARAEEILNTDMLSLFCDMEDAGEYIKELYSAGTIGLVELQQKFRLRMAHEAMAIAACRVGADEIAINYMAIQDDDKCSMLEMRRA